MGRREAGASNLMQAMKNQKYVTWKKDKVGIEGYEEANSGGVLKGGLGW